MWNARRISMGSVFSRIFLWCVKHSCAEIQLDGGCDWHIDLEKKATSPSGVFTKWSWRHFNSGQSHGRKSQKWEQMLKYFQYFTILILIPKYNCRRLVSLFTMVLSAVKIRMLCALCLVTCFTDKYWYVQYHHVTLLKYQIFQILYTLCINAWNIGSYSHRNVYIDATFQYFTHIDVYVMLECSNFKCCYQRIWWLT